MTGGSASRAGSAASPHARPRGNPQWALALALVLLAALTSPGTARAGRSESSTSSRVARDAAFAGEWRLDSRRDDARVEMMLKHESHQGSNNTLWRSTFDIGPSELSGITRSQWSAANTPVSFALERDAGSIRCEGRLRRGAGSGSFVFEPSVEFRAGLERAGFQDVTTENLMRLCLHDVTSSEIRRARARDPRPTVDELIHLKQRGEL